MRWTCAGSDERNTNQTNNDWQDRAVMDLADATPASTGPFTWVPCRSRGSCDTDSHVLMASKHTEWRNAPGSPPHCHLATFILPQGSSFVSRALLVSVAHCPDVSKASSHVLHASFMLAFCRYVGSSYLGHATARREGASDAVQAFPFLLRFEGVCV
jgi:hypothetical protein